MPPRLRVVPSRAWIRTTSSRLSFGPQAAGSTSCRPAKRSSSRSRSGCTVRPVSGRCAPPSSARSATWARPRPSCSASRPTWARASGVARTSGPKPSAKASSRASAPRGRGGRRVSVSPSAGSSTWATCSSCRSSSRTTCSPRRSSSARRRPSTPTWPRTIARACPSLLSPSPSAPWRSCSASRRTPRPSPSAAITPPRTPSRVSSSARVRPAGSASPWCSPTHTPTCSMHASASPTVLPPGPSTSTRPSGATAASCRWASAPPAATSPTGSPRSA